VESPSSLDSNPRRKVQTRGKGKKKKLYLREGVEGTLNLTLESMHHPSHIGPPPSPLACNLIPLFAMPC
jgi:hypothetical protein